MIMLYTFNMIYIYINVINYRYRLCAWCVVYHCLRVMLFTGRQPLWTGEVMPDFKWVTNRQGFGGIGLCLPLAGHIPDLGCDKVGIRARFRGRWQYACSPCSGSLSVTDVTMGYVRTVSRSTWNDKNQCNGVATNLFV